PSVDRHQPLKVILWMPGVTVRYTHQCESERSVRFSARSMRRHFTPLIPGMPVIQLKLSTPTRSAPISDIAVYQWHAINSVTRPDPSAAPCDVCAIRRETTPR